MKKIYINVQVQGGKILYRGVENGRKIQKKLDYAPTLFVPSKTETEYHGVLGEALGKINPGNIRETRDFVEKYSGVESFPIYGQRRYEYCYISDNFPGMIDWDIENIVVANLDIEVGSDDGFPEPDVAKEPITAVTMKRAGHFHVFGIGPFTHSRKDLTYTRCLDETDLLEKFLNCWCEMYPDIITGWNVKYFDITYLVNRIVKILGEASAKRLSPWNNLRLETSEYMEVERTTYKILGIAVWDYLQLFRKYSKGGWSHESYKLDAIAFDVLGKRKVSYAEYENLRRLYKENHQLFIEYNISDVELVDEIDAKEKIIDLCLTMAYDAKVNYEDVFSQVRMWDVIIYNHLRPKKMVIPPMSSHSKSEKYAGAFVKEPQTGMHNWIASFDLTSLYPHLIMEFNISPDTLIHPEDYSPGITNIVRTMDISVDDLLKNAPAFREKLVPEKVTMTPNRQFFTLEKHGFLPEIMQMMFDDRKKYKQLMLKAEKAKIAAKDPAEKKEQENLESKFDNLQRAKKEALNSAYGALGNQWFRYFAIPLAEGVTSSGKLVIQWIGQALNRYINKLLKTTNVDYIIASDTDSVYIDMEGIMKMVYGDKLTETKIEDVIDMMGKICAEKIQPFIDKTCEELGLALNVYAQKMDMKREVLANKGIWTAKKKYLLYVYNSEGVQYAEPKLKISGLEAIRSSTPTACRGKIKEALKIIMTKDEDALIDFISDFREEFEKLPLEEIAFPRSVNDVEDYVGTETNAVYSKGTPIQVKATLFYNKAIQDRGLEGKHELIKQGEKIKFIQLKEPNIFRTPIIAFPVRPPEEFNLPSVVDYELQFHKSFIKPLRLVLDKIGWKTEKSNSLLAFL
jgi:DNA polymerase elongation subunit (family B)